MLRIEVITSCDPGRVDVRLRWECQEGGRGRGGKETPRQDSVCRVGRKINGRHFSCMFDKWTLVKVHKQTGELKSVLGKRYRRRRTVNIGVNRWVKAKNWKRNQNH